MVINLHLGLPKTATTSIQNFVFPNISGVSYRGKGGGDKTDNSLRDQLFHCWTLFQNGDSFVEFMDSWISEAISSGNKRILISEEALMEWRSPRHPEAAEWVTLRNSSVDKPRMGPHPINEFLSMIDARLPNETKLRAILTLRNQADYMGSLYAQTMTRKISYIEDSLENNDPSLNFYSIVNDLHETLGENNLLLLFFEDGLEFNSKRISDFIGATVQIASFEELATLNVKRIGQSAWKTGPTEPRIVTTTIRKMNEIRFWRIMLSAVKKVAPWVLRLVPKQTRIVYISTEQKKAIKSHFRKDNDQLSQLVGRDLRELGY